jgi:hypothetical protein
LGRGLSLLIFGRIIAVIVDLESKKAGESSDVLGKLHEFKENFH